MKKQLDENEMISYTRKDAPNGNRYCQYKKDTVPSWATDIQPHKQKQIKTFTDVIAEINGLLSI